MAENKTQAHGGDVAAFIETVADEKQRADAHAIAAMMARLSGEPAKMWGPSIIGFGRYHYKYDSGREGDMCRAGFSPRKANMSLYLMSGYSDSEAGAKMAALRDRLRKHKTGASCLYINKLADVDMAVLREMIEADWAWMNERYPA